MNPYYSVTINGTDYEIVETDNHGWCWTNRADEGIDFETPCEAMQSAINYEHIKRMDEYVC